MALDLQNLMTGLATYDTTAMTQELLVVYIILGIIIFLGMYIYMGFAYQSIARKTRVKPAGISWIPIVGPMIIAARSSKRKACPIWLLLVATAAYVGAVFTVTTIWLSTLLLIIALVGYIIVAVYSIIWHWWMFKTLKYPGWWALFALGSSIGQIIHLTLVGIAAWLEK